MSHANPKIDVVIRIGAKIEENVMRFMRNFNELVRENEIDLKMVQVYNEFANHFISSAKVKKNINLEKIHRQAHFKDISSNFRPTLIVY